MSATEILLLIPDWIELIAVGLMGLTVAATVIARLTPTKADDEVVNKFTALLLKAISFAPTLGVNPRTKKMEETIKMLQEEKKVEPAA